MSQSQHHHDEAERFADRAEMNANGDTSDRELALVLAQVAQVHATLAVATAIVDIDERLGRLG